MNLLLDVLAPDVTLWTDGGGKVQAAQRVIHGRDKVTRLLAMAGELFGVLVVDLSEQGDRLRAIYGVVNPDKLTMLAGPLRERP